MEDLDDDLLGFENVSQTDEDKKSLFQEILEEEDFGKTTIYDDILAFSKIICDKHGNKSEDYEPLLKRIGDYIGTSNPVRTGIFCAVFAFNVTNESEAELDNIADTLNIKYSDALKIKKHIDWLCDENLLLDALFFDRETSKARISYSVPELIIHAALDNKSFNKDEIFTRKSMAQFLRSTIDNRWSMDPAETLREIRRMEDKWRKCEGIQLAREKLPDIHDRVILYRCLFSRLSENPPPRLDMMVSSVFVRQLDQRTYIETFREKKNLLLTQDFCECSGEGILSKVSIEATDKAITEFLGEEAENYIRRECSKLLMMPENIAEKKLFYSDSMNEQLETLYRIFDRDNFEKIQERLGAKGMKKGVTVLLYGAPGTGKTESVMQIAKSTGRPVYHVDISEAKSCYLGESQKLVKKIFNVYKRESRAAVRNGSLMPIMLLNEADALISKRKDANSSKIAQEENAIQDVLLEEIENLEGILLATTNIHENMDDAFERRFLFKIKYEKPELKTRVKIWKSRLEHLSDEDAESLASEYEFSGGEIDNIVRKIEIDEILKGTVPETSRIREMCGREKFSSQEERKIGF